MDIETGKILAQEESDMTGRGEDALARGMEDSVKELEAGGTNIGPLSTGRTP